MFGNVDLKTTGLPNDCVLSRCIALLSKRYLALQGIARAARALVFETRCDMFN